MRYPETHKSEVRKRIVDVAAAAIRKDGLASVSIPSVMKKAGMTHGGFYNHFADRDELLREAVLVAARSTTPFGDDERSLREVIDGYLQPGHVAHPELGCVLAALGTEAPRQAAGVRRTFSEVAHGFLRALERKRRPSAEDVTGTDVSDATLVLAAQMVGAVVLSRLVRDAGLRDRLLSAARAAAR